MLSRRTRKQLVGKTENYDIREREWVYRDLARELHRAWWVGRRLLGTGTDDDLPSQAA